MLHEAIRKQIRRVILFTWIYVVKKYIKLKKTMLCSNRKHYSYALIYKKRVLIQTSEKNLK